MSLETLEAANYRLPGMFEHTKECCRDCAERRKSPGYGNRIGCALHDVNFVRHSHRCDNFHKKGTLF